MLLLEKAGLRVEMTVEGEALHFDPKWTALQLAQWIAMEVFPDAYRYLVEAGRRNSLVRRFDEFIPAKMRYNDLTLLPFGGKAKGDKGAEVGWTGKTLHAATSRSVVTPGQKTSSLVSIMHC
jgi:hypothetical protein